MKIANMVLLIILIIVVLLSFNLFRNLFKSDVTILDDVKLKEEDTNNIGFALMIETENGWTTSVSAKIGLIYVHDYYYAPQSGGLNCYSQGTTCNEGWMFITGNGNNYERTMYRYGALSNGSYNAWVVFFEGAMFSSLLTDTYAVRPVFFLAFDVEYSSGTGVLNDLFIIN